ncbi:hypothetical protein D3C85_1050760 [compost metagenome]
MVLTKVKGDVVIVAAIGRGQHVVEEIQGADDKPVWIENAVLAGHQLGNIIFQGNFGVRVTLANQLFGLRADQVAELLAETLGSALNRSAVTIAGAVVVFAEQAIEQFAELVTNTAELFADTAKQGVGLVDLAAEIVAQLVEAFIGSTLIAVLGTGVAGSARCLGVVVLVAIGIAAVGGMIGRGGRYLLGRIAGIKADLLTVGVATVAGVFIGWVATPGAVEGATAAFVFEAALLTVERTAAGLLILEAVSGVAVGDAIFRGLAGGGG